MQDVPRGRGCAGTEIGSVGLFQFFFVLQSVGRLPCTLRKGCSSSTAAAVRAGQEGEPPLLGEDGQRVLHECRELDYMTHIVLRMFENTT